MKKVILLFALFFYSIIFLRAQSQDTTKIDHKLSGIDHNIDQMNHGEDEIDRAKSAIKRLGLFKGKKRKIDSSQVSLKPSSEAIVSTSTPAVKTSTVEQTPNHLITITGITFPKLRLLQDNIKSCTGVQSAAMHFNSTVSTIEVSYKGSSEDLLKLMLQTSKDIISEKNVDSFDEGKISIKL